MTDTSKTIIAIATPHGAGAIGIIRISGSGCYEKVAPYFSGFRTKRANYLTYGELNCGEYKDKCMGVYFAAPNSYTGEDSIELHLHGSFTLLNGVVRYFIENCGFTMAEGGDFTARAFTNGKLDLTEAEGVYDLIAAQSEAELRGAYSLLTGKLKDTIENVQRLIISARANTEAAIDYPEEDVEEQSAIEVKKEIENISKQLNALINTYKQGKIMREGVAVALIGKPNVGKSSLMNAILGYDRAIVTNEMGTTRDTLTESYVYNGLRFNLTDTAGLREAQSLPEKMGIERANSAAMESDIALVLIENGEDNSESLLTAKKLKSGGRKVIIVENKSDKNSKSSDTSDIKVSALNGEGIERLKQLIYDNVGVSFSGGASINNERQFNCCIEAREHIERALANVGVMPLELISSDLYDAYNALGKITGISGSDALAAEIFKRFCVGK